MLDLVMSEPLCKATLEKGPAIRRSRLSYFHSIDLA